MKLFKKIDLFVLKAYLLLFFGTFFVCLFIFMMQFMWRYMDELVGKGLPVDTLLLFFYYAGLTLVPMALPLAILLAALITFGNFGERFELLSMKAAGIPLVRIILPVFLFVAGLSIASLFFQNYTSPYATKQLGTLLLSMRQKSPELEIPEGIFYSDIPGYNLYVERKDLETGMLYGLMIYSNTDGYEDAQIVLADSGRLQSTEDKTHLLLTLYDGERFQNMQQQGSIGERTNVPYLRETFIKEVDVITFDANFNMLDAAQLRGNASTKNLREIVAGIDSLTLRSDSVGRSTYAHTTTGFMRRNLPEGQKDSARLVARIVPPEDIDSAFLHLSTEQKQNVMRSALYKSRNGKAEYEFRTLITNDTNRQLRLHLVEWHKKFTLSVSCIIFFFIGAPLGAIIRKGGMGVPVVLSVLIFIFYYIINASGEKLAKSGEIVIWLGVWQSSIILFPIGAFLTYKANRDSVVFNMEGYRNFFRQLLGLRTSRHLHRKEVVINDPDLVLCRQRWEALCTDCRRYAKTARLYRMPNYYRLFFRHRADTTAINLCERLEEQVEILGNSRDHIILGALNEVPILVPDAHTRPFRHSSKLNIATGLLLPVGLFFWLRIWRYRLRLWRDLATIQKQGATIIARLDKLIQVNEQKQA